MLCILGYTLHREECGIDHHGDGLPWGREIEDELKDETFGGGGELMIENLDPVSGMLINESIEEN